MKFLILGSNGFLGSYICNELNNLSINYVPINRELWNKLKEKNIRNWCLQNEITSIIFCSGYSKRFQAEEIENIDELEVLNILIKECNVKFIYLSSSLVYGVGRDSTHKKVSENSIVYPSGEYGMYKRLLERIVLQSNENNCIMRLVSCIGKSKKSGLMQSIENQIKSQKEVITMIHGNSTRDYLWVGYAAKLITQIALNPKSKGIFNIGSGIGIKVSQVIEKFAKFYNVDIKKIQFGKLMPEDPEFLVLDVSKSKLYIPSSLENEIFNADQIKKYLMEKIH